MPTLAQILASLEPHNPSSGGGASSGQRWLDNRSMEMVPIAGLHVSNGARDSHAILNPALITTDANGNQVTPRWNVTGDFGREGFWGGGGRNAAEIMAAAALGSYGLGSFAGAGALEGAGAGAGELAGGGSVGAGAGASSGGALDLGAIADAVGQPSSYWSQLASSGGVLSDAVPEGIVGAEGAAGGGAAGGLGAAAGGGVDAAGGALGGDLAGAGSGTGAFDMGGSSGFGGSTYVPPGVGDYVQAGIGRVGDAVAANPMASARGAMGLASLLGGVSQSHGAPAPNSVTSILEQMANSNRVDQMNPYGSRTWSQGPDGRWTVNDAFNPTSQAQFDALNGLHTNVNTLAQQRLAALLAGPQTSYSAPFDWGGRRIGG